MIVRGSAIQLAVFAVLLGESFAAEIHNSEFGFRLTVPDEFFATETAATEPETLNRFVSREPSPDDPAYVIQIQRLHGVIDPTVRMDESELQATTGMPVALLDFRWRGMVLDVMRTPTQFPGGVKYVVFSIQYPLSEEAVQLQVGGPAAAEEEVYALFSQLAGDFENTRPLYSRPKLPPEERQQKLFFGIAGLAITAVVILFFLRLFGRILFGRRSGG